MAVPFRTSGNYVMGHRVDRKTGMYKGRQVLDVK